MDRIVNAVNGKQPTLDNENFPGVFISDLPAWNTDFQSKTPVDILRYILRQVNGTAVVSTNFRPYEAVVLHLALQAQPGIPVIWVDHGYNRPATYRHAEKLRGLLNLNLKSYLPRLTPAHRDAIRGPVPGPEDEEGLKAFSTEMKLEPFQRAMSELKPAIWITGLRKSQNAHRAGLDIAVFDPTFGALKVSPVLHWSDEQMEHYLRKHHLPNELDYFDPAKASDQRECGLHAGWGAQAIQQQLEPAGAA